MLKHHSANLHLKNSHGSTALHVAASKKDNHKIITSLLNTGANANSTDKYGNTPLHIATRNHGNIKTIKALLKAGANPNAMNNNFETPLSMAENNNKYISLLNCYGAKFQSSIFTVLKLSFNTTPTLKKFMLMSFSITILSIAIAISVLTSGKAFIVILFAILASLGMSVICLEDQYHKIRELEKNTMNDKNSTEKN